MWACIPLFCAVNSDINSFCYCCSSTFVFIFTSPHLLLHPSPPPTLEPTPFGFLHVSFIHGPWWPTHYLLLPLSLFLSDYCQIVLYFNVSAWILLACLFCWLGSTYRWDHMVLHFHRECRLVQPLWKTVWDFLTKLKMELLLTQQYQCWRYTFRILKHQLKEPMHPNIHSSTIYNSQVLEANQMPMSK